MVVPLPKYVAISSSSEKKYLRSVGSTHLMKFDAVNLYSARVKHEVVPSKSHPGKVHIKCVDTGKYLSWGLDRASENYIAAQATKPLSDKSSNACTLIKYSHEMKGSVSRFRLKFRWDKKWHIIRKEGLGFLKSGETKGGRISEAFIIEDWVQLSRASTKNTASSTGKTSAGGTGSSTGPKNSGGTGASSSNNGGLPAIGSLSISGVSVTIRK